MSSVGRQRAGHLHGVTSSSSSSRRPSLAEWADSVSRYTRCDASSSSATASNSASKDDSANIIHLEYYDEHGDDVIGTDGVIVNSSTRTLCDTLEPRLRERGLSCASCHFFLPGSKTPVPEKAPAHCLTGHRLLVKLRPSATPFTDCGGANESIAARRGGSGRSSCSSGGGNGQTTTATSITAPTTSSSRGAHSEDATAPLHSGMTPNGTSPPRKISADTVGRSGSAARILAKAVTAVHQRSGSAGTTTSVENENSAMATAGAGSDESASCSIELQQHHQLPHADEWTGQPQPQQHQQQQHHPQHATTTTVLTAGNGNGTRRARSSTSTRISIFFGKEKSELISQLNELRDRKDASGRPSVPPELEIETSWRDIVSEERVLSKRATDQQEAIWEFITTELTYIQHMTLFSTLYSWFCELQQHGFLRDIAAHRVFLNAPELHAVNLELWRRSIWPMLEEARQQGAPLDPTRLSGGLADITFWSRCYIDFNIHQSDARQYVLRKCKEHELFREFVTWCEGLEEMQRHRHKLHDMLAYPFQRLTRYYLLLRAILKLSADHDEKALLQTLTDRAEASVAQLNAEMNNNELRLALAELMRQLDTYEPVDSDEFDRLFPGKRCVLNLTAPMPYLPGPPRFRRVLTRGDLKMRETRTGAKQELHAILLSDMLLLCRPTGRRPAGASADRLRVVRPPLHVSNLSFYPFPDLGGFYLLALNEFDVPSCLLMLWTSSSDETRKWLEILTMAVDEWQREFRRLSENGGSQSVDGEEFLYGNALPPPSMFGIPPGPGSAATTTATTTTMAAGGENGLFHRKSSSVDGQVAAVLQGHYANHHYGPPPPPPQHARYLHHYIGGGGGGGGAPVHHHQYITRDHHPIRKASMGASMCGATSTEQLLGRAESARSLVNANAASIRHMHKQSVCSMDCAISTEHLLGVGSTLLPQSKSSVDLAQPHPQHQHHSSTGSLVDQQQQQQQQQQQLQRPPPMHANSVESATHSRQTSIDLVPAPTTAPNAHLLHCVPQDDVACTSETNNNGGGGMCGPNSANSRRFERRYHTSDGIEVVRCAPPSSSTSLSSNGPTSILKRFSWNVSSGAGASSRKIHSRLHEQNRRQSTSTASASSESFSSSTSGVSSTSSQSTDGAEPTSECTATAVVDAHVSTVAVPPTANATLHEEDEREDVSTSSLVPPAVPSTLPPRSPDSSGTTSPSSSASSLSVDQQQQQQQQQQHQQQQHQEHQKQQHHQQEQRARLLRMIIDDALETSYVDCGLPKGSRELQRSLNAYDRRK